MALKANSLSKCGHCGKPIPGHQVCKFCGFYKGKEVLNIIAKQLAKREKAAPQSARR